MSRSYIGFKKATLSPQAYDQVHLSVKALSIMEMKYITWNWIKNTDWVWA